MGEKFDRLKKKIEHNERSAHPSYSAKRIEYIAQARAGEIYREKKDNGCIACRAGVKHMHYR